MLTAVSLGGSATPEVLFDSATWAATLPGTDLWANYSTWDLWPGRSRGDLSDAGAIATHVRAVFAVQAGLNLPFLAPTVTVSATSSDEARIALAIAAEAMRQQPSALVSVCGTDSFWRGGPTLDTHVGRLARLRPPGFYLVPMRAQRKYPADLTDIAAMAGWLRSIHSLSLRGRVIAAYTDHLGPAAAVAGASSIGTGWDQGQRACSPDAFRSGGSGSNVNYSPQPGLLARTSDTVALAVQDLAPGFAEAMRWHEPIPPNMQQARRQHLLSLTAMVEGVASEPTHAARASVLRHEIAGASVSWDYAIRLGVDGITSVERGQWLERLRDGFEAYALAEGI